MKQISDIRDFDAISAAIERRDEDLISAEMANAILDGKNPVKVWRKYRGLTQQQLAGAVEISKPYLALIREVRSQLNQRLMPYDTPQGFFPLLIPTAKSSILNYSNERQVVHTIY